MQVNKHARTFTLFQSLYLSFFSRPLYRDIRRNWKGLGLPYLLLILMIYWVPEMMHIKNIISEFIADEVPQYVDQVPTITIVGGKASIKESDPFYVYDKKNNRPVAIIDTSGQILSLDNSPAMALLTRDSLIIRQDRDTKETRSLSLSDLGDITITSRLIYNWLEVFKDLFAIVLFPFALLISFFFHIAQTLLLAVLGGSFAKYFNVQIDFKSLVRLSVVAFTPAIMLETAHAVVDIYYPYSSLFSFLITSGYLFYAVGCNSEETAIPIKKAP